MICITIAIERGGLKVLMIPDTLFMAEHGAFYKHDGYVSRYLPIYSKIYSCPRLKITGVWLGDIGFYGLRS